MSNLTKEQTAAYFARAVAAMGVQEIGALEDMLEMSDQSIKSYLDAKAMPKMKTICKLSKLSGLPLTVLDAEFAKKVERCALVAKLKRNAYLNLEYTQFLRAFAELRGQLAMDADEIRRIFDFFIGKDTNLTVAGVEKFSEFLNHADMAKILQISSVRWRVQRWFALNYGEEFANSMRKADGAYVFDVGESRIYECRIRLNGRREGRRLGADFAAVFKETGRVSIAREVWV